MTSPTEIDLQGNRSLCVIGLQAYASAPTDTDVVGFRDISGLAVTLNVTLPASGASVALDVYGIDPGSGNEYLLGAVVALTGTGQTTLIIHPAIPTAAVASGIQKSQMTIPERVRFHVVQSATAATYSVGLSCVA